MKAAVVTGPGVTPVYTDFSEPVVTDGTELVDLVAAGIHPAVRALVSGAHYASAESWPVVAGIDAVARTTEGTLVYTGMIRPPFGTFAERMAAPSRFRFALPPEADAHLVAGGVNPGAASWIPLTARVEELAGKDLGAVVVLGATGSAGTLAVQNAKLLGATKIVAAGRESARLERVADLGAQTVLLGDDVAANAAAISDALDGEAPSTVIDFVWGQVAEASFAALARRGADEDTANIVHIQIGSSAGEYAATPASLLRSRKFRVQGSGGGSMNMAHVMQEFPRYLQLLSSGQLTLPVHAVSLSQVAEAWATGTDQRVVLTP